MVDLILGNPILAAIMLIAAGWAAAETRATSTKPARYRSGGDVGHQPVTP